MKMYIILDNILLHRDSSASIMSPMLALLAALLLKQSAAYLVYHACVCM